MATPAQLVNVISDVTGTPLATITDIDRRLIKVGLRTKHGRGFNAARMTALDAARILVALLASPQVTQSVDAVTRYAATQADSTRSSDGLFVASMLDDLAALPARHSFVEGIAALVASATNGSLAKLTTPDNNCTPRVEVFAFTRATYGRIRIADLPNGQTVNVEYIPSRNDTKAKRAKDAPKPAKAGVTGDLEQSRRITERTILSIAALLAEES